MPLGKYNKYKSNSDFKGDHITTSPNARGANGVYNHHPSPGLANYPASKGPGDIDEKFAETGVGDANTQKNQLRQSTGVRREGKAPLVTSSNMNRSKNPYRSTANKTSMKKNPLR